VIDFGGSLGSTYLQHRPFWRDLQIRWCVVEQPHFVACGKELFEDDELRFCGSISECLAHEAPDVILFSSVLQYLEDPAMPLRAVLAAEVPFVMVDRTPFNRESRNRLTVQRVPPTIYPGSYPCWLLDERKLLDVLRGDYETIAQFDSPDRANAACVFRGFILARRTDVAHARP
jgi:putative methyltransferase (TIGR04325 family)